MIQFVRNNPPYNSGERASFSKGEEAKLVRMGFAKPVSNGGKSKPVAPAPTADKKVAEVTKPSTGFFGSLKNTVNK